MTVTLKLRPDMEARLQAKAQVQGISTEDFLQSLLENALAPISVGEAIALYAAQTVTQGQQFWLVSHEQNSLTLLAKQGFLCSSTAPKRS